MYNQSLIALARSLKKQAGSLPDSAVAPAPNPAQERAAQQQMMAEQPTQTVANPEIQEAQQQSAEVAQQADAQMSELQGQMQQMQQESQAAMAKVQQTHTYKVLRTYNRYTTNR